MTVKEIKNNLNKKVRYKNDKLMIDSEYTLNACIFRKNEYGIYCQAEIQRNQGSIMIVGLENISAIEEGQLYDE